MVFQSDLTAATIGTDNAHPSPEASRPVRDLIALTTERADNGTRRESIHVYVNVANDLAEMAEFRPVGPVWPLLQLVSRSHLRCF